MPRYGGHGRFTAPRNQQGTRANRRVGQGCDALHQPVTLVTAAKDPQHSHVAVLLDLLGASLG